MKESKENLLNNRSDAISTSRPEVAKPVNTTDCDGLQRGTNRSDEFLRSSEPLQQNLGRKARSLDPLYHYKRGI